jgi:small subunit ribosomal protein S3
MGQKVNPIGLRLGINRTWDSRWYASGPQFSTLLHQDIAIRAFLREKLNAAGISKIIIERPLKKCRSRFLKPASSSVRRALTSKNSAGTRKMAPGAEVHLNLGNPQAGNRCDAGR